LDTNLIHIPGGGLPTEPPEEREPPGVRGEQMDRGDEEYHVALERAIARRGRAADRAQKEKETADGAPLRD